MQVIKFSFLKEIFTRKSFFKKSKSTQEYKITVIFSAQFKYFTCVSDFMATFFLYLLLSFCCFLVCCFDDFMLTYLWIFMAEWHNTTHTFFKYILWMVCTFIWTFSQMIVNLIHPPWMKLNGFFFWFAELLYKINKRIKIIFERKTKRRLFKKCNIHNNIWLNCKFFFLRFYFHRHYTFKIYPWG